MPNMNNLQNNTNNNNQNPSINNQQSTTYFNKLNVYLYIIILDVSQCN